jgi:serine/threonine protein kinase
MQVADGLSAAHQQGIVHRDIKPSNILLEEGVDRALISDFGLARAADDASLTRTGFHPGTPQYMSPEQASGQSVDARSDLFSLGSMLYTMCTGRPPFRAENSLSVMRRISESEPTPIQEINPKIPEWMCAVITKLMAKSLPDRISSAAEVRGLLEALLRQEGLQEEG